MSTTPVRLLLLEDNPGDARLVQAALADQAQGEFVITTAPRLADALSWLGAESFDAILCDLGLPDSTGLATAQAVAVRAPALPLVVLTGTHDQSLGRAAIQQGAQDYLVKGESSGTLIARTLLYAIERKRLEIGLRSANEALEHRVARRTLALSRQKDLYAVLSQTNQTIVRCTSREELFAAICRIAVEYGHFLFAWIGLIRAEDGRLKPVANYGEDSGYVKEVRVAVDKSGPPSRGLTALALSTGRRGVSNDVLNDPVSAPWHEAVRRAGVRALGTFPLRCGGAVVGVMNFYSGEPGYFTDDLLATLDEMAVDVSFALDNFEREAQRKRAEVELRQSEARSRSLFDNMLNGFAYCRMEYDARGLPVDFVYLDVNEAFERLTGLKNVVGKKVTEIIPGIRESNPELFEIYGRVANSGVAEVFENYIEPLRHWFSISVYGPEKGHFVAIFDVITQRKNAERALSEAVAQFRCLVEQSIAGSYILQEDKFAYVNPRFVEIFGYDSAEELIGRDPMSIVAEKDRAVASDSLRRRLEGEVQNLSTGFTGQRKNGSLIEVGMHSSRATYRGRPAIIGLMQDISEKKRAEEQAQRHLEQLEIAFMSTVKIAMTLGEMRDPYTAGHERRVAEIAAAIGAKLGFDERRQEGLRVAGYLHDIGKITVPSEILSKPGKLTAIEFKLIQNHPQASYEVLKVVEFPWPVAQVALQHHERIDGSGYPQGLKGEAILYEARIMAVADTVEAMSSHRPYRAGLGIEQALAEIERGRGTAYDADVVDACLRLFRVERYPLPN